MATIDLWDIVSLAQDDAEFIESYHGGKDGWIEQICCLHRRTWSDISFPDNLWNY
jgi:hypothetical protein